MFQNDAAASASPLSALFGSAAPATGLLFQPPPKVPTSTAEQKQKPAEVRGQAGLACKRKTKLPVMQSKAEQRLEGR